MEILVISVIIFYYISAVLFYYLTLPKKDNDPDYIASKSAILTTIILVTLSIAVSRFYYFNPISDLGSTLTDVILFISSPFFTWPVIFYILPSFLVKYCNLKDPFNDGFFYTSIFPFFTLPYMSYMLSDSSDIYTQKVYQSLYIEVCYIGGLMLLLSIFSLILKHPIMREQIILKIVYALTFWMIFTRSFLNIPESKGEGCVVAFCSIGILILSAFRTERLYKQKQNKNKETGNEKDSTESEI